MQLYFKLDASLEETLTWAEYEALSGSDMGQIRKIISRFMVEESGEKIPQPKAYEILGGLKFAEIREAVEAFSKAIQDAAVNPTTAAKS